MKEKTLFEAMQAFDALSGAVAFTTNEIALFYALLYSWNAAHRPAVLQQWADTTCSKCALEKKHAFPDARNGLVQKGVIFTGKTGNRGVPHYSLAALFKLPNPILLPNKGSKSGSKHGSKHRSKGGVNTGVKADSYEDKGKGKESPPISPKGDNEKESIFPKGSKSKPIREQKKIRVLRNNPLMIRMGKWFNRSETTLWTVAEAKSLQMVNPSIEERDLMEKYYSSSCEYLRKDLYTLLGNWNIEVDRAKAFVGQKTKSSKSSSSTFRFND